MCGGWRVGEVTQRRPGRWREGLAFEAAQVAKREARTGCPLSARQLEVLSLFASGEAASKKDVCRILGISESTVHNHIAAAGRALDSSGTIQTMVFAVQQGWVSLPQPAENEAA